MTAKERATKLLGVPCTCKGMAKAGLDRTKWGCLHCAVAEEIRAAEQAAYDAAIAAIRAECTQCDSGVADVRAETVPVHAPDCDGSCANCPVPEMEAVPIECEYCGRPIAAIERLIGGG